MCSKNKTELGKDRIEVMLLFALIVVSLANTEIKRLLKQKKYMTAFQSYAKRYNKVYQGPTDEAFRLCAFLVCCLEVVE